MITIIKADKDLCKRVDSEGKLLPYQNAFLYDVESQNVKNIEEFSALLTELEGRPRHGIIRDEPLDYSRGRRLKSRFNQVARPWLLLDHDDPAPEGCPDYVQEPERALKWMIEHKWPFLKGVGIHWQLGNSAGIVPAKEKMSFHLWVMLDKPVCNASVWLGEHGFDVSMTSPVQIHYTASPLGVNIPKRSGLIHGGLLSGVTENPPPSRSGVKYQEGYKCTERDIAMMDMEWEALNGDKGRHGAVSWWITRAVSVSYPDVHDRAVDKLVSWGRDPSVADSEVARIISWAKTGYADGSLEVDCSLRPDLAFPDDLDEEESVVEDVEAQAEALGCGSLIKGLKTAEDKYDWLGENAKRATGLSAVEKGRLREAWGSGVRVFDNALKEAASSGEGENWDVVASSFLKSRHNPLIYVDAEWYTWTGTHYTKMEEIWVKKELSAVVDEPTTARVSNAYQQLQFAALRAMSGEPKGTPFLNGRLMPDGTLVDHTPENGGRYCLSFNYDPSAVCPMWEQSLGEWFNDSERPLILRQWMNYLLSGRGDLHKIMLFTGLQRGGKGTIIGVMQDLIGADNYSNPSMSAFASDFGLQNSVGKGAIFVSDAHLPARDRSTILDRLKGISGKDRIDVMRKNMTDVAGATLGQIIIACNEMDDIKDESNALIDRYSIIQFTNSFLGRENTSLNKIIKSELPGIFNWARNCEEFEAFHEDSKGIALKEDMSLSANPVRSWALEACSEEGTTATAVLYRAYELWSEENGLKRHWDKNVFVRKLKSIFPKAVTVTVRENKKQVKCLKGLSLKGDLPLESGFEDF